METHEKAQALMGLRHIAVRSSLVGSVLAGVPIVLLARSPATLSIAEVALGLECRPVIATACSSPVLRHPPLGASPKQPGGPARRAPEVAVKAAFLYNFARFTEWPKLAPEAPIVACIVGDGRIAAALMEIDRAHTVADHRLVLGRSEDSATWQTCHLLFISDSHIGPSAAALTAITAFPVLTVSDTKGFAQAGGIIEFYPNAGQLRFAINVTAAERSGLRLSSRLLSLAKIVGPAKAGPR